MDELTPQDEGLQYATFYLKIGILLCASLGSPMSAQQNNCCNDRNATSRMYDDIVLLA